MGLMRDGRIRALEMNMICDGGAYGLSTEGVMRKAAILAAGPYVIPNVKVDTYGIYTNNTPSGAFRSFGALQTAFATESHLDICAERLGLDPFQIRRINAMRDGAITHTKAEARLGEPDARARCRGKGLRLGSRARRSRAATRAAISIATIFGRPVRAGRALCGADKQEAAE